MLNEATSSVTHGLPLLGDFVRLLAAARKGNLHITYPSSIGVLKAPLSYAALRRLDSGGDRVELPDVAEGE
jgi:hypothetical protein